MQPKDDIAHFAKSLIKKIYATHRPLVQVKLFLGLPLLKLSNYSVPTSITSSESEILLLFPSLFRQQEKREKVSFISAFHPRASCCSAAASATSLEHASGRAPALWQYIYISERIIKSPSFLLYFQVYSNKARDTQLPRAVSPANILTKFLKILHKSTQGKLSSSKLIFGCHMLAQERNLIYGSPKDQTKLVQFIDNFL